MSGRSSDIADGMDGSCRDEQFLARFRMVDLPRDLKLHSAVNYHNDFVRAVNEVFPPLSGRIGP